MNINYRILLADDDNDDCLFFSEVLDELPIDTTLHTVNNGVNLMDYLSNTTNQLPQILFLDLNMPLKDGTECLSDIRKNKNLADLKVIIISTSLNMDIVNSLYDKGADYYICKPAEFSKLKKVIHQAIEKSSLDEYQKPLITEFVLQ